MEVESLANTSPKKKDRRSLLLVLLGIILAVQVCSASDPEVKATASPSHVYLGQSVTISTHVYHPGNPGVIMANNPVMVQVWKPDLTHEYLYSTTNASGWATNTYTPGKIGDYGLVGFTRIGTAWYPAPLLLIGLGDFNVSAAPTLIPKLPTQKFAPLGTLTPTPAVQPVTSAASVQQTSTGTQVTLITPVTQLTQATQATPAIPASKSDTTPPVTTLTLAGTEDGSSGYNSAVICTLTATDNSGGSGVSVIQYSFDGTSWNTYSQPFPLTRTGPMVIYYRSSDNAGNTEVTNVKAFAIGGTGAAPAGTPAGSVPNAAPAGTASADAIPFFPLPLWLVALILFVIVAAIGGALYLESQQKKEKK
jgi:hypothetical protein